MVQFVSFQYALLILLCLIPLHSAYGLTSSTASNLNEVVLDHRNNTILLDRTTQAVGTKSLPLSSEPFKIHVTGTGDLGRPNLPTKVVCVYKNQDHVLTSSVHSLNSDTGTVLPGSPFYCFIPDLFNASDNKGVVQVELHNSQTSVSFDLDPIKNCILLDKQPESLGLNPVGAANFIVGSEGNFGQAALPAQGLMMFKRASDGALEAKTFQNGSRILNISANKVGYFVLLDLFNKNDNFGKTRLVALSKDPNLQYFGYVQGSNDFGVSSTYTNVVTMNVKYDAVINDTCYGCMAEDNWQHFHISSIMSFDDLLLDQTQGNNVLRPNWRELLDRFIKFNAPKMNVFNTAFLYPIDETDLRCSSNDTDWSLQCMSRMAEVYLYFKKSLPQFELSISWADDQHLYLTKPLVEYMMKTVPFDWVGAHWYGMRHPYYETASAIIPSGRTPFREHIKWVKSLMRPDAKLVLVGDGFWNACWHSEVPFCEMGNVAHEDYQIAKAEGANALIFLVWDKLNECTISYATIDFDLRAKDLNCYNSGMSPRCRHIEIGSNLFDIPISELSDQISSGNCDSY